MASDKFHLRFFIIFFCCFYLALNLCIHPSSAEANPGQLAHQVCKNTTNYLFCEEAVYSDPRASSADRYVLAYIAFGKAYLNATDTSDYIASLMNNVTTGVNHNQKQLHDLQKCKSYYKEAIRALSEALNDLDSETFDGLDELAVSADNASQNCEATFIKGHSPLSQKNQNLSALSKICIVVSKLYTVS